MDIPNGNKFYFHMPKQNNTDLIIYDCGHEHATPEKETVNVHFPFYSLHFIVSGTGFFIQNNSETKVTANTFFIVYPNQNISIRQDPDNPWEYYWINFSGALSQEICKNTKFSLFEPFYQPKNNFEDVFIDIMNTPPDHFYLITSDFYKILSMIVSERHIKDFKKPSDTYLISLILDYVNVNFTNAHLTQKLLSERYHITSPYISRIFKNKTGTTFSSYLTLMRMQKAQELLEKSNLSIKEVAELSGYEDQLYFSKVFKQYRLYTPTAYRQRIKNLADSKDDL